MATSLEKEIKWLEDRLLECKKDNLSNNNKREHNPAFYARQLRRKALFLIMYSASFDKTSAARRCKIGIRTVHDWIQHDECFKNLVWEVEEAQIDWVQSKMFKRIGEGSDRLIEFYMKTKGKSRGYTEEVTSYEDDVIEFTLNPGRKLLKENNDDKEAE